MFFMRFSVILWFVFISAIGQDKYPKDYFRSPLGIATKVSGSFGELRPNHFHSGLDFRTDKQEGLPVYASADGFVSRIKISTGGYGKSLYIDHPNGFTTVYGHLQQCNPEIQKLVNEEHYDKKNYEIEIFLKANEISVKKGDLIAYSGNTGSSGGPHLHFEFRDTKTEKVINPLFFGFDADMKDQNPPVINGLLGYSMDDTSQINGSNKPVLIPLTLQKDGTYLAGKVLASGKISFGINAYDTSTESYSKNGIFKLDTYLNGMPYFGFEFDSFSFDETKYINTFIDYEIYKSQKQRFQKLFLGLSYPNSIMKITKNDGIINVSTNLNLNYKVIVQDFHGNKTIVNIPISYANLPIKIKKETNKTPYFLKARNDNSYFKDDISLFIPEKTFNEDFYLKFNVKDNQLLLNENAIAVNNHMTITFDVTKIPSEEREKMFIANVSNGILSYNTTYKKDDSFSIKTKNLGKFYITSDSIAPKIYKPNFEEGSNLDTQKTLQIYISDNLSGIKTYNAYLNGEWILMEYESKLNRLRHNLSDAIYTNGKNEFKIIVTDNLGNSTTFESTFTKTK